MCAYLDVVKLAENMKKITTLIFGLLISICSFTQTNSPINKQRGFLKIGQQAILYLREINIYENTVYYSSFEYEQRESTTLEVKTHKKYYYTIDPDTGKLVAVEGCFSNEIRVNDYFGELFPSETKEMFLTEPIWVNESGDTTIIKNYELIITSKHKYIQFGSCEIYFNSELQYELSDLQKGDYIILRRLETNRTMTILGLDEIIGYWKIK